MALVKSVVSSEPSVLEKSGERKTERDVGLFQERGEECIQVKAFLGCWLRVLHSGQSWGL